MKEKQFYVYTHARPNTNDAHGIFYVGKGVEKRTKDLSKRNEHHKRITKKYGSKNIIIRSIACSSEQHAFDLEVQIISMLRRIGVDLANVTDGGEGKSGWTASIETRNKISESNKGNKSALGAVRSEEARKKIGAAHKGKVVSSETLLKMSIAVKNQSAETRAKRSIAAKNRPKITDETRLKLIKNGKNKSPEHLEKLRIAMLGNKHGLGKTASEEARRKMSESQRARRKLEKEKNVEMVRQIGLEPITNGL
jgi:hypothetical protein